MALDERRAARAALAVKRGQRLEAIPGAPPDLSEVPTSCSFAARCKFAEARCLGAVPPLSAVSDSHLVRCVLAA